MVQGDTFMCAHRHPPDSSRCQQRHTAAVSSAPHRLKCAVAILTEMAEGRTPDAEMVELVSE